MKQTAGAFRYIIAALFGLGVATNPWPVSAHPHEEDKGGVSGAVGSLSGGGDVGGASREDRDDRPMTFTPVSATYFQVTEVRLEEFNQSVARIASLVSGEIDGAPATRGKLAGEVMTLDRILTSLAVRVGWLESRLNLDFGSAAIKEVRDAHGRIRTIAEGTGPIDQVSADLAFLTTWGARFPNNFRFQKQNYLNGAN